MSLTSQFFYAYCIFFYTYKNRIPDVVINYCRMTQYYLWQSISKEISEKFSLHSIITSQTRQTAIYIIPSQHVDRFAAFGSLEIQG